MRQKKLKFTVLAILLIVTILSQNSIAEKNIPTEIARISLGSDVTSYPGLTQSNFMKEVVITDWHGFRKGVVSYGACEHINQILKINLKYENKSKRFYKKLLKSFRKDFGEPSEWKGDSFGVVYTWKWYFSDSQGNKVSLTLQHNSKNANETIGNIVKLSYPEKIDKERRCFSEMCQQNNKNSTPAMREERRNTDWTYLIPR